jgi:CcmD family protein
MEYMVAAYAVLWAISFGLVVSMIARQRRISAELETLRLMLEDEPRREQER